MVMRKLSRSDSEPTREPCENVQSTEPISVPYIVHEGIQARFERMLKRLWITNIILIILLVATNVGWLIYESQFQVIQSYDVEQEFDLSVRQVKTIVYRSEEIIFRHARIMPDV